MEKLPIKFKKAFSLAELAIAIAVIAILTAVLIPVFSNMLSKAKTSDIKVTAKNMNTSLGIYEAENGKPDNVISAVSLLYSEGFNLNSLISGEDYNIVYNINANRIIIYNSEFTEIIYNETSMESYARTTKIKANTEATETSSGLYALGTNNLDEAVEAGITSFCIYSPENDVNVQTDCAISIHIYNEEQTEAIDAPNADIYHYSYNSTTCKYAVSSCSLATDNNDEDDETKENDNDKSGDNEGDESQGENEEKDEPKEEAHEHELGGWVIYKEATCNECGIEMCYCSGCDYYEEREISKLEHKYTSTTYDATVDECEHTVYTCTLCGDSYTETTGNEYLCTPELTFTLSGAGDDAYYIVTDISDKTITEIYIPSYYKGITVKEIAASAFIGNTAITIVTMGYTIETIGEKAFYDCTSIKKVILPENLKSLSSYCFYGCTSLEEVTIPKNLTSFGDCCFYNCSALEVIYYNAISASEINKGGTFSNAGSQAYLTVYISADVTYIPQNLFNYLNNSYCHARKIIFEQDSKCTEIGQLAFANLKYLEVLVIPSSINKIKLRAFYNINENIKIYFCGNEDEWSKFKLSITDNNSCLTNYTNIYYYDENKSAECWYYADNLTPVLVTE